MLVLTRSTCSHGACHACDDDSPDDSLPPRGVIVRVAGINAADLTALCTALGRMRSSTPRQRPRGRCCPWHRAFNSPCHTQTLPLDRRRRPSTGRITAVCIHGLTATSAISGIKARQVRTPGGCSVVVNGLRMWPRGRRMAVLMDCNHSSGVPANVSPTRCFHPCMLTNRWSLLTTSAAHACPHASASASRCSRRPDGFITSSGSMLLPSLPSAV